MQRPRSAWQCLLLAVTCEACAAQADNAGAVPYSDVDERDSAFRDSDADGLCDGTEALLGTDPSAKDSDGDGLFDAHEDIAGTDPRDRFDPNADRIVYLPFGASVEMPLSVVIDTPVSAVLGKLSDRSALDPHARRAGDFYSFSYALSAEPPDSVRTVDPSGPRFSGVLSRTQLQFRLQFVADSEAREDCAAVLPFDYVASDETGQPLARERAVLIVGRSGRDDAALDFCLPAACL